MLQHTPSSCTQWIPPHERARCVSLTTSGMCGGLFRASSAQEFVCFSQVQRSLEHATSFDAAQESIDTMHFTGIKEERETSHAFHSLSFFATGMYLGSAAAMLVLPSVAAHFGASSLLKVVGCLGLSWLAMWLAVGKEVSHRCVRACTSVRACVCACPCVILFPCEVVCGLQNCLYIACMPSVAKGAQYMRAHAPMHQPSLCTAIIRCLCTPFGVL